MSVLIYASRAVETADGETVFNSATAGTAGSNSLSLTYAARGEAQHPPGRPGSWT